MMNYEYPHDATTLDPDEALGLIPSHISTQDQLNEWEAANILKAEKWIANNLKKHFLFSIDFTKLLHKKMFNDTWKWAGIFRHTEKNIGVTPSSITTKLKILLEDVDFQIRNNSYEIDEIAYRFHHRLVSIHPFPNGNGRHARMMTDALLIKNDQQRFSWGSNNLATENVTRKHYINALKNADKHNYIDLAAFVRS